MTDIHQLRGATLGGYRLDRCLGHGSHTAVYEAVDGPGSSLAVKLVDGAVEPGDGLLDRLKREADELARLDDPSILAIQEPGTDGPYTFAAARMLEGPTLADAMAQGTLDSEGAWGVLSSVADAVDNACRRGLSCRVLKPSNVLFDDTGRPHLAEFGITGRMVGAKALTSPRYRLRFPQYLAPEQVQGAEPDWRADIYAAGVLVFELLTGSALFDDRNPAEVLRAAGSSSIPSAHARNPALPPAVDQVLSRALSRDPYARQRSVWELLDELVNLPEVEPPPAPEPAPSPGEAATASAVLRRMGVPVLEFHGSPLLNSYAACLLRQARVVSGGRWPDVLAAADLREYLNHLPPDNGDRQVRVEEMSRLADGLEQLFGDDAQVWLRELGRATTEEWMKATQRRPFRMMGKSSSRVSDALLVLTSSMDRIRGEQLHAWKQIDDQQFWIIHYANLLGVGRRKPRPSCQFWVGAYEAALQWAGPGDEWVVDEVECGCVTGTDNCVFAVQRGRR